jgi:hypothetical protein
MKKQHTPGPWHITKDTTRGEFVTYTKVRDQHDGVIAIMSTMNENANAHLIASAPELLAALEALSNAATMSDLAFHPSNVEACTIIAKAKWGAK